MRGSFQGREGTVRVGGGPCRRRKLRRKVFKLLEGLVKGGFFTGQTRPGSSQCGEVGRQGGVVPGRNQRPLSPGPVRAQRAAEKGCLLAWARLMDPRGEGQLSDCAD